MRRWEEPIEAQVPVQELQWAGSDLEGSLKLAAAAAAVSGVRMMVNHLHQLMATPRLLQKLAADWLLRFPWVTGAPLRFSAHFYLLSQTHTHE